MPRSTRSLLAVSIVLVVAACKAPVVADSRLAPAKASPAASQAPATTPDSAAKPALLAPPKSGTFHTVSGQIQVDAGYLVSHDGGSLVSHDGGSLVSHDGGSLVSHDGGSVVSVVAGALVSHDGGSLVSHDGGSILATTGGNLVVPDPEVVLAGDDVAEVGGALVSHDGGSLVSHDGGSLVSHDGGSYHALDAAAPPAGQELPAAGMWVRAVSLLDDSVVPLGVDSVSGKPVYVVATDTNGNFNAYLPNDLPESVRLIASVPNSLDPRQTYTYLVASQAASGLVLDDTAALDTLTLRLALSESLNREVFQDKGVLPSLLKTDPVSAANFSSLYATAQAMGFECLSTEAKYRVAQRVADVLLCHFGLGANGASGSAGLLPADLQAVSDGMKAIQAATTPLLGQAGDLEGRAWAIAAWQDGVRFGIPVWPIEKSSDAAQRLIIGDFGATDNRVKEELQAALYGLQVPADVATALKNADVDIVTQMIGLGGQLDLNPPVKPGGPALLDAMTAALKSALDGAPPPSACPAPAVADPGAPTPGPSAVAVSTFAGDNGANGEQDGLPAVAGIGSPCDAAIDGQTMYVVEAVGTIRKIELTGPNPHVTTIAGLAYVPGADDGPGASARFRSLFSCALDTQHHLYVEDGGSFDPSSAQAGTAIRKVDLTAPYAVTTLAGRSDLAGYQDGTGTAARFGLPGGLALDAAGNLLICDPNNRCMRHLDVTTGVVTTVLGAPQQPPGQQDGRVPVGSATDDRRVDRPTWPVYAPDGRLFFIDGSAIRVLDTAKNLITLTGGDDNILGPVPTFWLGGTFGLLAGLALLPDGTLVAGDYQDDRLLRVQLDARGDGALGWPIAGGGALGTPALRVAGGNVDGTDAAAVRFGQLGGLVSDGQGNVYVCDTGNNSIRRVTLVSPR